MLACAISKRASRSPAAISVRAGSGRPSAGRPSTMASWSSADARSITSPTAPWPVSSLPVPSPPRGWCRRRARGAPGRSGRRARPGRWRRGRRASTAIAIEPQSTSNSAPKDCAATRSGAEGHLARALLASEEHHGEQPTLAVPEALRRASWAARSAPRRWRGSGTPGEVLTPRRGPGHPHHGHGAPVPPLAPPPPRRRGRGGSGSRGPGMARGGRARARAPPRLRVAAGALGLLGQHPRQRASSPRARPGAARGRAATRRGRSSRAPPSPSAPERRRPVRHSKSTQPSENTSARGVDVALAARLLGRHVAGRARAARRFGSRPPRVSPTRAMPKSSSFARVDAPVDEEEVATA